MNLSICEDNNKPNIWLYTAMLHSHALGEAECAYWKGFYQGLKWLLRGQPVFLAIPDTVGHSLKNAELNGFWASIHAIDPTYIDYKAGIDPIKRERFFCEHQPEIAI